ncbi:DUF5007 domain-containing protein [Pedobacter changchengzhani]|uniref:DUF5007 domain-containing protein n=1 Tax=Pedobacter changchengzhani TaxID=2529274 RepID=A0A4R5MM72_9SPHI|nr:DUF5007 domain-containing protein [Pedobacter changchengzhani]TDG36219.1 DUF5007 domain-containing protein [Pedobacter changchengzhani]
MKNMKNKQILFFSLLGATLSFASCKKNLPDNRLSLADNTLYVQQNFQPVLGRNTLFANIVQYGSSSRPLDFKIINFRTFAGDPADELNKIYPVSVWKKAYDGTEKSLAEIDEKRAIENHPLFEIRPHSGELLMWAAANSNTLKTQPDSGYVFDIEMSNSGGRKYFQNFRLMPLKERDFEPSYLDPVLGQGTSTSVFPSAVNIVGERTGQNLGGSVRVLFNKVGNGRSITFKFIDTLSQVIDPNKFATTDWKNLVHGFNMVKTNTSVKFDVAYPIPLTDYPTRYTTVFGGQATSVFKFERKGFGDVLEKNFVALNYNIYKQGDWEVTIWFTGEKPKFDND